MACISTALLPEKHKPLPKPLSYNCRSGRKVVTGEPSAHAASLRALLPSQSCCCCCCCWVFGFWAPTYMLCSGLFGICLPSAALIHVTGSGGSGRGSLPRMHPPEIPAFPPTTDCAWGPGLLPAVPTPTPTSFLSSAKGVAFSPRR